MSWYSHCNAKYFHARKQEPSGQSFIDFGQRLFQGKSKCLKVLTIALTYFILLVPYFSPLPQIGLSEVQNPDHYHNNHTNRAPRNAICFNSIVMERKLHIEVLIGDLEDGTKTLSIRDRLEWTLPIK